MRLTFERAHRLIARRDGQFDGIAYGRAIWRRVWYDRPRLLECVHRFRGSVRQNNNAQCDINTGPPSSVRRAALAATSIALTERSGSFRLAGIDFRTAARESVASLISLRATSLWVRAGSRSSGSPQPPPAGAENHTVSRIATQHCSPWPLARSRSRAKRARKFWLPSGIALGFNTWPAADQPAAPFRGAFVSHSSGPSSRLQGIRAHPAGSLEPAALLQPFSNGLPTLKREELRPSHGQIVILVHQRIPDGDLGITGPVGAARSNVALLMMMVPNGSGRSFAAGLPSYQ